MSFPLAFPPKHRRFAKGRPAFHCSALDTTAEAVSVECTDGSLQPEDWEAVEIDERAAIPVVVAPNADWLAGRRVVKPYRTLMASFKAKRGLR